jgi:PEP-CTERM motif-containing protein
MRIAGIADCTGCGPYTVSFDGTSIGTIAHNTDANAFQEVLTYTFAVPIGLLNGADTVLINTGSGDGFSIDYSQLTVNTTATVPEPASILLLGSGLVVAFRRRRRVAS